MKKVYVTKPVLPSFSKYKRMISSIWKNHILTNFGPLNNELSNRLKEYLNVSRLHYVNNGTSALLLSIDAIGKCGGEIITTPFTFIATISAIVWQKYKPVFVDIEPEYFNIDIKNIEKHISSKTVAILAVHSFGFPCDVKKLSKISSKYNIPIIYDASHCFGVTIDGKSLFKYGDISICSLHATKLFHTIEGGLCIVNNDKYDNHINAAKNFGINNDYYECVGINAKASEFNAAMGLCLLDQVYDIINIRKNKSKIYSNTLSSKLYIPKIPENCEYNYIYYPILFDDKKQLQLAVKELNKENIYPKTYFFPCINDIPIYKTKYKTPIAKNISERILCLPLDTYITNKQIKKICKIINSIVEIN